MPFVMSDGIEPRGKNQTIMPWLSHLCANTPPPWTLKPCPKELFPLCVTAQPELLPSELVHVGLTRWPVIASAAFEIVHVGPVCSVIWLSVFRLTPSGQVQSHQRVVRRDLSGVHTHR